MPSAYARSATTTPPLAAESLAAIRRGALTAYSVQR
jgi:hypothetical protein